MCCSRKLFWSERNFLSSLCIFKKLQIYLLGSHIHLMLTHAFPNFSISWCVLVLHFHLPNPKRPLISFHCTHEKVSYLIINPKILRRMYVCQRTFLSGADRRETDVLIAGYILVIKRIHCNKKWAKRSFPLENNPPGRGEIPMWILEHLSLHSHGFYTFFCAGKVFPSMNGNILPV